MIRNTPTWDANVSPFESVLSSEPTYGLGKYSRFATQKQTRMTKISNIKRASII
jgi:hypothetical protein